MLARLFSTLIKVAVASLIVGTVLAHFGITADQVLKDMGLTPERLAELARQGFSWALPNLLARLAGHRTGMAGSVPVPAAGHAQRVISPREALRPRPSPLGSRPCAARAAARDSPRPSARHRA